MFEQLLLLRRVYHRRSDYDREPTLSVPAAIEYGELRMRLSRLAHAHGRWQIPRAA